MHLILKIFIFLNMTVTKVILNVLEAFEIAILSLFRYIKYQTLFVLTQIRMGHFQKKHSF